MFRKTKPLPPRTKFSRLDSDALYDCIEQAVSSVTHSLSAYHTRSDEGVKLLQLTEIQLETALEATRALLRQLEVAQRVK